VRYRKNVFVVFDIKVADSKELLGNWGLYDSGAFLKGVECTFSILSGVIILLEFESLVKPINENRVKFSR